jgi:hypothetical protein
MRDYPNLEDLADDITQRYAYRDVEDSYDDDPMLDERDEGMDIGSDLAPDADPDDTDEEFEYERYRTYSDEVMDW